MNAKKRLHGWLFPKTLGDFIDEPLNVSVSRYQRFNLPKRVNNRSVVFAAKRSADIWITVFC